MSTYDKRQGGKDAADGKAPRDVQKDHWKVQQDYNAAYAAGKNKRP